MQNISADKIISHQKIFLTHATAWSKDDETRNDFVSSFDSEISEGSIRFGTCCRFCTNIHRLTEYFNHEKVA